MIPLTIKDTHIMPQTINPAINTLENFLMSYLNTERYSFLLEFPFYM